MVTVVKEKPMLSDRVRKLRQTLIEAQPRVSGERLKLLMQSYRETQEEPSVIKRAKCFEKVLIGMTIFIDENPIVGTLTKYRPGVQPYPEWAAAWLKRELETRSSLGTVVVSEEDGELMRQAIDYWQDKNMVYRTKQIWDQKYGGKVSRDDLVKGGVWLELVGEPQGRISVDYGKVLSKGLNGVIKEVEDEIRNLPLGPVENKRKLDFYNAVIISLKSMIQFARRYALLARDMAQRETDAERKKELERISETCDWVPANPAKTFYEAIQSFWFIHLGLQIEHTADGYSPGRFSQYMYPFYKRDKENGKITEEEAIELLELLFIKMTEIALHSPRTAFANNMGTLYQNLAIGGVTPSGDDATNELDFLVLEAQKRVRMIQPTLSLLYHDKLSEEFLIQCAEVVRTGIGMPAFFNNDVAIQRLLNLGVSLEDARNHCMIGCVETGLSHVQNSMWGGFFNMAKMLELALNNGKDPLIGKQLGPQTGEAEEFQCYDELCEAIKKQLEYSLPLMFEFDRAGLAVIAEHLPQPYISALVDDCIKRGEDITRGGSRYSLDGCGPVGVIDVANSLFAIKKLVFEEKTITMKELLEALQVNFEGKEELHHRLLEAPKYGNDEGYVEPIARQWYDMFWEVHHRFKDHLGRATIPFAISITAHFHFGSRTGTLPSGRKARQPLTDASVSASPGTDRKGPTALIKSATSVIDTTKYGSAQLNMKFHPSSLETREGLRKLLAMIKTYFDLGGHHVQFNVVSADTLKDAQLQPENYKDLIVRVAGFSAFFVNLDPVVQNEIIKRTELRFD